MITDVATNKVVKAPPSFSITEEQKESLVLMDVMKAIGQCKISKDAKDSEVHPLLDLALKQVRAQKPEYQNYVMEVFLRNLFYTFSIQRQHNIWKEEGVKSDELGAQMRKVGRSITRWLVKNMSDWLFSRRDGYLYNLNLLVEYANYDLLTHNQLRTNLGSKGSKKNPNRVVSHETMNVPLDLVAELMAQNYRRGKSKSLIARWLPKINTGKVRYTKLVVGQDLKRKAFDTTNKAWVSINGTKYQGDSLPKLLPIKDGDVIRYPRNVKPETISRMGIDGMIAASFYGRMGWTTKQYKDFRHEFMQLTPEHQFSSAEILRMSKDQFEKWLNGLSAGQQWVVSSTLCYKDKLGALAPKPNTKWEKTEFPKWYMGWATKQTHKTQDVRVAMAQGDTAKAKALAKEVKVKVTGTQTIDLLTDMLSGKKTEAEINTMHTALIAKMDMFVPVFPIIDGSGSMSGGVSINGKQVSYLAIACCLAVTFMVTNPVEEFRSSCMWFGSETAFTGVTKYADSSPNPFVQRGRFTKETGPTKVVDASKTFTENLRSLASANPGNVSSTNAGQVVVTFMKLVQSRQFTVEQLPKVLLFITDEEYNVGVGPVEANGTGFTQMPQTIGWNPLFVFWGIRTTQGIDKYKGSPNTLVTRGYQESNLSEILQFIKKGSITMYDELFAVHDMPGLSLIKA